MLARLKDVCFIAVDTDNKILNTSSTPNKVKADISKGSEPHQISDFKKKLLKEIGSLLKDAAMIFIVADMGQETDLKLLQVIAEATRSISIDMMVGVVTRSFTQKDGKLLAVAEKDIADLSMQVDSLIVIPDYGSADVDSSTKDLLNDNQTMVEAVRGITDLIYMTRFMSLDFGDVLSVLPSEGPATFGVGKGFGSNRAEEAFQKALQPLSHGGVDIRQAGSILVTVSGSMGLTMEDYNCITQLVSEKIQPNANIKLAVALDESLGDAVKVAIFLSRKGK